MYTEDGYIIDKCLNGDAAAFGLLVDKYKASVYALAYSKIGNFADAEDITQEVFLKAYQKLRTLKQWDKVLAWLYSITSNLCKDFLRSKSSRADCEYVANQEKAVLDRLSINAYHGRSMRQSLHDTLVDLPETHRQVLTLYYLGGMSCREIAEFLGTTPHTIEMRLTRARSKLKAEMLDEMSSTCEQKRLQPHFTLALVEMVKHTKIQSPPSTPQTPLIASVSAGVVVVLLSFMPSVGPIGRLGGTSRGGGAAVVDAIEGPISRRTVRDRAIAFRFLTSCYR